MHKDVITYAYLRIEEYSTVLTETNILVITYAYLRIEEVIEDILTGDCGAL